MNASLLPIWLQYLQAAAVLIIAAAGVWIAFQQMHIAHTKLKHDLYDRRFAIFEAARTLLAEVAIKGDASEDAVRNYVLGTANAVFLLDDGLARYMQEIGKHVSTLHVVQSTLPALINDTERSNVEKSKSENLAWLRDQIDVLPDKFKPILRLERRYR